MAGPQHVNTGENIPRNEKTGVPNPMVKGPNKRKEDETKNVRIEGNVLVTHKKEDGVVTNAGNKIANNPALIGGLVSAIVTAMVSYGLDPALSDSIQDLIVFVLITLGVGGISGVAVRQSVIPTRKLG